MKILIVYPHGLGDCIMATPALRQLHAEGHTISLAMSRRFKSSNIFDACPYISKQIWTSDMWLDHGGPGKGVDAIQRELQSFGYVETHDKVVFVRHPKRQHKVISTALQCDVSLTTHHTEVFISDKAKQLAEKYLPSKPFMFVHHDGSGDPKKNVPLSQVNVDMRDDLDRCVVGRDFPSVGFDINSQFYIMSKATKVCVIESAFFCAAVALQKKIDLAYFKNGRRGFHRVRDLNDTRPARMVYL